MKALLISPAVVQGLRRVVAAGFVAVGIPVCLTPVQAPGVGALRGFPGGAALCPIREGAP